MNYVTTLFKRPSKFRDFGAGYSPQWVNSLYLNIKKWSPNSTLSVVTDFESGFFPEIKTYSFINQERGWCCKLEMYRPEVVKERAILMDLDGLFIKTPEDIEHRQESYIVPRNPGRLCKLCNGFVSLNSDKADYIWNMWLKNKNDDIHNKKYFLEGQFSEMFWLNDHVTPDALWDDVTPGQLVSYKKHCSKGDIGMGIPTTACYVYFHGNPKQPELKDKKFIKQNWTFDDNHTKDILRVLNPIEDKKNIEITTPMKKFNTYNELWKYDYKRCPCDKHFINYVKSLNINDLSIFHLGTGGHHIVGDSLRDHNILGITASIKEYQEYMNMLETDPELSLKYKAFYGDMYTLNTVPFLNSFDIITNFHLCEFSKKYYKRKDRIIEDYGQQTDVELIKTLYSMLKDDGKMVMYKKSNEGKVAHQLVDDSGLFKKSHDYESLTIYTKIQKPKIDNIINAAERILVIGAHPDDETCWAGGLIASTPDKTWDSLTCSVPAEDSDKIRSICYIRATTALGISNAMSLPYVENRESTTLEMPNMLIDIISTYDLIITHSGSGEYGHKHHKFIHKWVVANIPNVPKLFFGYGSGTEFKLTDEVYEQKMNALKCYDQPTRRGTPVTWRRLLAAFPILEQKSEWFLTEQ
jgi:LmbE family N-acetylglucosaminyl deacetylase